MAVGGPGGGGIPSSIATRLTGAQRRPQRAERDRRQP